jgi:hypothetical protein
MMRLRPGDAAAYPGDCLALANSRLSGFGSPAEVAEAAADLNAYPGLGGLKDPESIRVLEPIPGLAAVGRKAALDGLILWEHPAAGEATRLGLGPKFFLRPADLAGIVGQSEAWSGLLPISLGLRHLIQPIVEIAALAEESGEDPVAALKRQTFLIISAESHAGAMTAQAMSVLPSALSLGNIWFMAQPRFHGMDKKPGGEWRFDPQSPLRLHNHGQMFLQKAMAGQIYRFDDGGRRHYLSREDFFARLDGFADLISNNIEDLDYLNQAVEPYSLGLAVRLGRSGHGMMMEINLNNRKSPIKGGMCAHDPALGRDVVIESFSLKNVLPKDIKYLNKNMNHYLNPAKVMAGIREKGLGMPVVVHDDRLYFQPVQGDINFLVKTAYFTRAHDKELNSLKYPSDIPSALTAMAAQDASPHFARLANLALKAQGRP